MVILAGHRNNREGIKGIEEADPNPNPVPEPGNEPGPGPGPEPGPEPEPEPEPECSHHRLWAAGVKHCGSTFCLIVGWVRVRVIGLG